MVSRRILAAALLLCAVGSPAYAQKTKLQITTEIPILFPDNTSGQITPLGLRTVVLDITNSIMPTAPVVAGNLACFSGTTGLLQDCGVSPTTIQISNIAGLGAGVATFLQTPSSANLAAALTDETGTGPIVFSISPALTGTPTAPTAAAGTNTTQLATTAGIVAERAATKTLTNTTYDSAGTGNSLSISGVAVSRGQFPGASTNTPASAGNIGEPKSQNILSGSAVSLTNATPTNIATITLTAGNWLLWAQTAFTGGATTTATGLRSSISTTSATENTASPNFAGSSYSGSFTPFATFDVGFAIAPIIVSLSGSQQYWLVSRANFATSTCSGYGGIFATRLP